jgi:peptidylprolyl isomerase
MRPSRVVLLALLLLSLIAAGCGSDDEGSSGVGDKAADTSAETQAATTETGPPTADIKDVKVKPVIDKPTGSPPNKLVKEDIVVGKGRAAKNGDTVSVQYVGVNFSNGQEFDASWDRGQPFSFALGGGMVIKGWDKGLVGMKVGGRRQLTIPPELGYGAAGSPPAIPPNETLVFVVDMQKIQ